MTNELTLHEDYEKAKRMNLYEVATRLGIEGFDNIVELGKISLENDCTLEEAYAIMKL